ncbi:MAG: hypothetical protein LC104_21010, partial [Bacteroidales bacterium]|nr:hypothetical protein [Bacteroidales bacterium]
MRQRIRLSLVLLGAGMLGIALAQSPNPTSKKATTPADEAALDAVTKQAATLETQLAKTSSTSAEAAEIMLKLMKLYHENGRPFGLIRVAQTFVGQHSA